MLTDFLSSLKVERNRDVSFLNTFVLCYKYFWFLQIAGSHQFSRRASSFVEQRVRVTARPSRAPHRNAGLKT